MSDDNGLSEVREREILAVQSPRAHDWLGRDGLRDLQLEAESLLAGAEHEVDSRRVLELVRDSDCSAYDCEFVALAMALGVKLVTMDARLLKAFPEHAVALSGG